MKLKYKTQRRILITGGGFLLLAACLWLFWPGEKCNPPGDAHLEALATEADLSNAKIEPDLSDGAKQGFLPSGGNGNLEGALKDIFLNTAARNAYTSWSASDLIAALESNQVDFAECQKMLWALCFLDDPVARDFLSRTVNDANVNEYLRASTLEGLAAAHAEWGYDLAFSALRSESEVVARSAIRALGQYGGDDAVAALSQLAFDFELDPTISLTAAEALGVVGSPEAAKALVNLFELGVMEGKNDAIEFALSGLGKIDSPEIGDYLKNVYELASDPEIRVLVLEGLEESEGNISEIIKLAMKDEDADVRAAAAWSLAYADGENLSTDELMAFMNEETDAEVRRNLYLALDNQDELDVNRLMDMVGAETDPSTQLAGYQLMCRQLMVSPDEFDVEFSGNVRAGLMLLRNEDSISSQETAVIDRLIDRIDRGRH